MTHWKPTAPLANLQKRAQILHDIRCFMQRGDVLELESPMMSQSGGQDVNIELIAADAMWLASSPEFPLKRAVAAGYGDVYSLQRVFRAGESGRRHNTEFTMLEWYRIGYSLEQLMSEVEALCQSVVEMPPAAVKSYRSLFLEHTELDPFADSDKQRLAELGSKLSGIEIDQLDFDGWLDVIFSHLIEPKLSAPTFVYNFLPSQAALSRIEVIDGVSVARRFELIWRGVELANGYHELNDADEQRQRFARDRLIRSERNQPLYPIDDRLLEAVGHLPDCAGVAMGVDRLVMLACNTDTIEDVLLFPDRLS